MTAQKTNSAVAESTEFVKPMGPSQGSIHFRLLEWLPGSPKADGLGQLGRQLLAWPKLLRSVLCVYLVQPSFLGLSGEITEVLLT
jgi:hypothetical protein